MTCIAVLTPYIGIDILHYRKQIRRSRGVILVYDVLHRLLPFYKKLLVGLLTTIGKNAVLKVFLLEVCHIDKRHSTGIETEHKHIARIIH